MRNLVRLGAVVCGLAGCASSPPVHFYTLSELTTQVHPARAGGVPLRLRQVTIPAELDREQLVLRLSSTRLAILENEQWAAPLEDMIRRVLSDDLAARLPAGSVRDPGEPAPRASSASSLSVDIHEFYADERCAVSLRAAWVLSAAQSRSTRATEQIHIPGAGCSEPGAVPLAMSRALGVLSDRIARGVEAAGAGAGQSDGS